MATDPFPRDRVTAMLRRMPAYLRLAWRLAKDPLLSKARRAAVVGAAGYLASPIDLVPGVVPVLGQLDDLAVALAAIRLALSGLSPEQRHVHLEAVGLRDEDLVDDLRTLGATTAWFARAGYRTTKKVAVAGVGAASAGAGAVARTSKSAAAMAAPVARAAADKAAPAAKAVADRAAPTAKAMAARAQPVATATGRVAKDAGAKARTAGGRVAGAAGAAMGRIPKLGRREPEVLVTEVDVRLLPPPSPDRTRG